MAKDGSKWPEAAAEFITDEFKVQFLKKAKLAHDDNDGHTQFM